MVPARSLAPVVPLLFAGCAPERGIRAVSPPVFEGEPLALQTDRVEDWFPVWEPPLRQADVLWVIDGSCSMTDDQALLNEHLPIFIRRFVESDVDFHIGVVDAGGAQGASGRLISANGLRWIDTKTRNPTGVFEQMAAQVTGQSRGAQVTFDALDTHRDGFNRGFQRDGTPIHAIVISDEPDGPPPAGFFDWFMSLMPDPQDRTFSSIVDPADNSFYERATEVVGGVFHDITSGGWEDVLDELALQASRPSNAELFLSLTPIPETLTVQMRQGEQGDEVVLENLVEATYNEDGVPISGHWTFDLERNSVLFVQDLPKAPHDALVISYVARSEGVGDTGG